MPILRSPTITHIRTKVYDPPPRYQPTTTTTKCVNVAGLASKTLLLFHHPPSPMSWCLLWFRWRGDDIIHLQFRITSMKWPLMEVVREESYYQYRLLLIWSGQFQRRSDSICLVPNWNFLNIPIYLSRLYDQLLWWWRVKDKGNGLCGWSEE